MYITPYLCFDTPLHAHAVGKNQVYVLKGSLMLLVHSIRTIVTSFSFSPSVNGNCMLGLFSKTVAYAEPVRVTKKNTYSQNTLRR